MKYSGFIENNRGVSLPTQSEKNEGYTSSSWILFQRIGAVLLLALLSPLFLLIFCIVKLDSNGPFLFRQKRTGKDGRVFTIFKVRTMRLGSEANTALGVNNTAPEITSFGRFFRALKFDELPQLINIVRGEMLFVGPRPIPLALETELRSLIPGFGRRYEVSPGMTSIGQICIEDNSLGDALIEDWKFRFQGELHYIRKQGIAYDMVMIVMTAVFVLKKIFSKK